MSQSPQLEMRGICKRFPGVVALDHVDLVVAPGEVHVLLGENGAGKSTLMSIASGLYRPDAGEIWLEGRPVDIRSPRAAMALGIGMVHQHFRLVPSFSVWENLALTDDKAGFWLRENQERLRQLSAQFGLQVNPSAHIWQLSVGERQRVEILRILARGARVLILDEPTAVLAPAEVEAFFVSLRRMAASGTSVVLITHKLEEVMTVADRITVLRAGRNVATVDRTEVDPVRLAELMIGQRLPQVPASPVTAPGEPVLVVDGLTARSDAGLTALDQVSFTVHAGEVVGVAGVAGNGQRELAEVLGGLRPAESGRVIVAGYDVTRAGVAERYERGLALIPEDRLGVGLASSLSMTENLILRSYKRPPVARGVRIDWAAARRQARALLERFRVQVPDLDLAAGILSGGNQQRVLLARELAGSPRVIVAVQPTRGLDFAAAAAVHQALLEQKAAGAGLLLVSEDLSEVLQLSDHVLVMYRGAIVGRFDAARVDPARIGQLMAGLGAVEGVPA